MDYRRRSLQEQRQVHRQWGIRGKAAEDEEHRLEQAYNLSRAEAKIHKATNHPEQGEELTIEDIHSEIRNGRKRP